MFVERKLRMTSVSAISICHYLKLKSFRSFHTALLHVKSPIKFNRDVQPLCLSTEDPNPGDFATVTGFGWTNEDFSLGEKPDSLQSAVVPIWSNIDCQTSYIHLMKSNRISENQLCAGGRNGGLDCKKKY